jgi:hypothetical protein
MNIWRFGAIDAGKAIVDALTTAYGVITYGGQDLFLGSILQVDYPINLEVGAAENVFIAPCLSYVTTQVINNSGNATNTIICPTYTSISMNVNTSLVCAGTNTIFIMKATNSGTAFAIQGPSGSPSWATSTTPQGLGIPPAIPASGTAYTNQYGLTCQVCISGGTDVSIAISGLSTELSSGCFIICPGQTITITYTTAPTWAWFLF